MKGEKLMAVIGAVLGDIAGSQFEFNRPENLDYKHCELFTNRCSYTDDTIMTLAVKKAILENADFTKTMREIGQPYPYSGYGGRFYEWMYGENPRPYNSFGNGSAMRVSFVGEHFDALEDVISMAEKYEYSIAVPLDKLEKIYQWNETCMGSVPAAMRCFYESDSYESFLRNVFRLKCDSDILAAIGGAVAEEYYGWTGFYNEDELLKKYLDANLYNLVKL